MSAADRSSAPEPRTDAEALERVSAFYRERVPADFNATLERQRNAATGDPAAARLLEEMEAVRASIVLRVEHAHGPRTFAFDVDRGVMTTGDTPARTPFLVLGHAVEDFEALRRECGDSLLGFLGSLAGLGDALRLTSQRVRSLRELAGSLVLERVGPGGFTLFAHFGVEAPSAAPGATIRLDENVHRSLRAGELDAQTAFLDGRIEVEGDEGLAIGLALAAMSPD